jgi:hypothetical protein
MLKSNNNNFDINIQTSVKMDECNMYDSHFYNNKIENYYLGENINNTYNNSQADVYLNSSNVLGLNSQNMYGFSNKITDENNFRNGTQGSIMTNIKGREYKELDTRLFIGSPYMSSGQSILKNPDLHSKLINGLDTHSRKADNSLAGVSIDRFIPLVPCISNNVQNVEHIIPEYWIRGGMSTRVVIRNADYLKSCGKRSKSAN